MSGQAIALELEKRSTSGKKVKSLRNNGLVPAVVYERGKESELLQAPYLAMSRTWATAGKHHVVELNYDGKKRMSIIKDISLDPKKGTITHISFHSIKMDEKLTAEVPIKVIGEIPAERLGYFLVHPLDFVELKGLPGDMPDVIEVSGEKLENPGDNLLVGDLKVDKTKIEIMTELDRPVAIVEEPRASIEAEVEAEEEVESEETAEGEGSAETKDAAETAEEK